MKIYTEEQMAKVWMAGQKYWETSGASITFEELLEHEKTIKLPSDEEIIKDWGSGVHLYFVDGFEAGAKWVINHIKQQDNG